MNNIYTRASLAYSEMQNFRDDRRRCKRYVYGDQWLDKIPYKGGHISEADYIRSQGQEPLKNNLIRRVVRNVVGVYRANMKMPDPAIYHPKATKEERKNLKAEIRLFYIENRLEELLPRLLEEFLISGLVAVKVSDGIAVPVTPDNFFFHSDGYDPRGWNVDLVGELHSVSYADLLQEFCHGVKDLRRLQSVYGKNVSSGQMCRLVEVWYSATEPIVVVHDRNKAKIKTTLMEMPLNLDSIPSSGVDVHTFTRTRWRQAWFAADGTLLREADSSDGHPYRFKAYPFIDGEFHSYVNDIIDQQRYINRLITTYDYVLRSSAKGVLLFPDKSLPKGMNLQDVADEWSRYDGVIAYSAQPGIPAPQQVSSAGASSGIADLLNIQMNMLEDISGVTPTLQGKIQTQATSGTLFAQQNAAAQTSLLDVIRTFESFAQSLFTP